MKTSAPIFDSENLLWIFLYLYKKYASFYKRVIKLYASLDLFFYALCFPVASSLELPPFTFFYPAFLRKQGLRNQ